MDTRRLHRRLTVRHIRALRHVQHNRLLVRHGITFNTRPLLRTTNLVRTVSHHRRQIPFIVRRRDPIRRASQPHSTLTLTPTLDNTSRLTPVGVSIRSTVARYTFSFTRQHSTTRLLRRLAGQVTRSTMDNFSTVLITFTT